MPGYRSKGPIIVSRVWFSIMSRLLRYNVNNNIMIYIKAWFEYGFESESECCSRKKSYSAIN